MEKTNTIMLAVRNITVRFSLTQYPDKWTNLSGGTNPTHHPKYEFLKYKNIPNILNMHA